MKIPFALYELGMDSEMVAVDLSKGEQRNPEFLALNPWGCVPVTVDGDLTVWESHAILAYLVEKSGKLWPTTAVGKANALQWLFFLAESIQPPAIDLARNRLAVEVVGGMPDEATIARAEKALAAPSQFSSSIWRKIDGC